MYRRTELKELIAMHSSAGERGGDLKTDTVTIIGGALDLQEKVVKQAMTPIENVFMLSIDAKLDFETLRTICKTGHSRVPVYEEVEVPVSNLLVQVRYPPIVPRRSAERALQGAKLSSGEGINSADSSHSLARTQKVKKIIGILLVKQVSNPATPFRANMS